MEDRLCALSPVTSSLGMAGPSSASAHFPGLFRLDNGRDHEWRQERASRVPHLDEEKKACRACSDFKSWMTKQTAAARTTKGASTQCPADKNELGRASWKLLHSVSVYLPEGELSQEQQKDVQDLMRSFSRLYPCDYCASDMRADLKLEPPLTSSGSEFASWLCRLHNKVNSKLNKPLFDCSQVYHRWRDGWPDGSCEPGAP